MDTSLIFISDLHLDMEEPDRISAFIRFLEFCRQERAELYILGDLLNFWAGNAQAQVKKLHPLLAALQEFSRYQNLFFLPGNRDFLFASYWEKRGGKVLPDGSVLELASYRLLLYHGDILCTGDLQYLRIRKYLQSRPIQILSRLLPAFLCIKIGRTLRSISRKAVAKKKPRLLKLNIPYMKELMEKHGCHILICGHVHFEDTISFETGKRQIFLLPECTGTAFRYLRFQNAEFRFEEFPAGRK